MIVDSEVTPHKGDYVVKVTEDKVIFGTLVRSDEEGWYISYHVNGIYHTQPIIKGDTVPYVDSIKYAESDNREALNI